MSNLNKLRRKAQSLLKKGKLDKAIEVYNKLLSSHGNNPNLNNELGDIYLKNNDKIMAVASFEKAAQNYEKVALYNNAVAVCKKIMRIAPDRPITIYRLGELKAKQNFLNEAEKYFNEYMDIILRDPDSMGEGNSERVEMIVDMMKGYDELHSKAVELFLALGMKYRAAELNAEIISSLQEKGDIADLDSIKKRMESLRSSLSPEEDSKIKEILGTAQTSRPTGAEDEMDAEELVSEEVVGSDGIMKGQDRFGQSPKTDEPAEGDETAGGTGSDIKAAGEDTGWEAAREEEAAEPVTGMDQTESSSGDDSRVEAHEERETVREEPFPPPELDDDAVHAIPSREKDESPVKESPIVESEDDYIVTDDVSRSGNLAEQIVSDVEKDDFKSHYDLGMAYIEMALYEDALKELQISSRCEEFRLQSLEMIGLCFISKGEPRLAVKQLERGLKIASGIGENSLGIHYNLGLAYEALGEEDKALEHFEEVYIIDVTFRDIEEKMKKFKTHA